MRRLIPLLLLALMLTGCGAASETGPSTAAPTSGVRLVQPSTAIQLIQEGYVVIDVRTPQEFAAGHLAGARNLDVQSPDFADQVAQLDRAGRYLVYCRSGNRSAAAAEQMKRVGFGNVADAGGFDQLVAAGAQTA